MSRFRPLSTALLTGALLLSCSTPPDSSHAPRATEPAAQPTLALAPFAPLVGGTWTAAMNEELRDDQEYTWVFGGKFLRNRHWVRAKDGRTVYEGETIYARDPQTGELVWWYWNATGGYITGTMSFENDTYTFDGENHGETGQTQRVRATLALGEDEWTSTSWFSRDGEWVQQGQRTYRRSGEMRRTPSWGTRSS